MSVSIFPKQQLYKMQKEEAKIHNFLCVPKMTATVLKTQGETKKSIMLLQHSVFKFLIWWKKKYKLSSFSAPLTPESLESTAERIKSRTHHENRPGRSASTATTLYESLISVSFTQRSLNRRDANTPATCSQPSQFLRIL